MSFSEWKEVKLGDILEPKGYIRGPFGSALIRKELENQGIPVYEQQNAIYNHRRFRFFINEIKYKELKRFTVKPNDLLVSCSGTVGKISIIQEKDPIGVISQALLILRGDKEKIISKYFYYLLASNNGLQEIKSVSSGSVQINIAKRNVIESITFKLPPLHEQKAIAEILSSLDDKINLNNRINNTLEEMAQAIFKSWFVDFEPFHDGEFEDSELGSIPKGWRVIELRDVCESVSKKHSFNKSELIFLNTSDILAGQVLHSNYSKIDEMPGQAKKSIQRRDILYSEIRPINKRYTYVNFEGDDYVVSTKLMVLRANEELINSRHLYHLLTSEKTLNNLQTVAESRSGTFPQITFAHVAELKVILPPIQIESEIGSIFELLYEKIDFNHMENKRLMEIRDALLPRLMSGEIRVPIEGVN